MSDAQPLVSVVMPAHDAEAYVRGAVESVLAQTVEELELIVVDDGSRDRTPALLAAVADPRLVVLRNEERLGVAASLNAGLDRARGRWLARLDADDVALPLRLERQLARLRAGPRISIVGSAVAELDGRGRIGRVHPMPVGAAEVRWRALFATPFWHPSVVVERRVLEEHGLRYDTSFDAGDAAEDYDLWARLLTVADGDNLAEPLVLYRHHGSQVSERRAARQLPARRRIGLRGISALGLDGERAELAWAAGSGETVPAERAGEAVDSLLELHERFAERHGAVRAAAAKEVVRLALRGGRPDLLGRGLALDPALPLRVARARARRRVQTRALRREAGPGLRGPLGAAPTRVTVVSPEPTPYRAPLFDRLAAREEVDLTVVYAARTVAGRTWTVAPRHRAVFLSGVRLPGVRRLLHHDYPLTPGVVRALREAQPDVVVASGWSTFTSQATLIWCRVGRVPYLLIVESHDLGPRAGWRRAVKGAVVPRIVRGSAGALVTGTLARDSMVARGARPERVRIFANTIDVEAWSERADGLGRRRAELRTALGLAQDDVAVLSVGRLAAEKAHDVLIRAVARARDPRLRLVLVGEGPERRALEALARELGVRLTLTGDLPHDRVVETYVAADVFALLSEREPWAVVVNEAAACGLPLVLSDRVGAAPDLLRDGENGRLVPAGDTAAAAAALHRLAADQDARLRAGARSREIVRDWGYGPSVEAFLSAVRDALASRP